MNVLTAGLNNIFLRRKFKIVDKVFHMIIHISPLVISLNANYPNKIIFTLRLITVMVVFILSLESTYEQFFSVSMHLITTIKNKIMKASRFGINQYESSVVNIVGLLKWASCVITIVTNL